MFMEKLSPSALEILFHQLLEKISSLHSSYKQNPLTGPNSLLLGYRMILKDFLYYFSCCLYKSCAQRTGDIDLVQKLLESRIKWHSSPCSSWGICSSPDSPLLYIDLPYGGRELNSVFTFEILNPLCQQLIIFFTSESSEILPCCVLKSVTVHWNVLKSLLIRILCFSFYHPGLRAKYPG